MARRIVFTQAGWEDYRSWKGEDPAVFEDVTEMIHSLAGGNEPPERVSTRLVLEQVAWSRRLHGRHRLVYLSAGDDFIVLQARYHES